MVILAPVLAARDQHDGAVREAGHGRDRGLRGCRDAVVDPQNAAFVRDRLQAVRERREVSQRRAQVRQGHAEVEARERAAQIQGVVLAEQWQLVPPRELPLACARDPVRRQVPPAGTP